MATGLVWLLAVAGAGGSSAEVRVLVVDGAIEVQGLAPEQVARLRGLSEEARQEILTLHVGNESRPPMLGLVELTTGGAPRFRPTFSLEPEVPYRAVVRIDTTAVYDLELPRREDPPTTRVLAVFPSSPELPENLLRFYLHFSAPMSRGDAYRFVRLLDHLGHPVEEAFLELDEELWDSEAQRLTLLFDPGRIKSGLRPKLEAGSALDTGHHFELEVDARWPDARGNPLVSAHRHLFRVSAPDYTTPDPISWRLSEPRAGSRDILVVGLDEPLDRALLERWLEVRRGEDRLLGETAIDHHESRWSFTPDEPWQPGEHRLVVDVRLEDRAGNRVDRAFERKAEEGAMAKPAGPPTVELGFLIRARAY